jgi:hypothetical protein
VLVESDERTIFLAVIFQIDDPFFLAQHKPIDLPGLSPIFFAL